MNKVIGSAICIAILLSLAAIGTTGAVASPQHSISNATYYISPDGSDSSPGTASQPWKTFAYAIPRLYPGDTLSLLDGIYETNTTGLPKINYTSGASNGTSESPITIRAENERQAYLRSDGSVSALELKRCSFWNVIGLRGSGADLPPSSGGTSSSVFEITYSADILLSRLLASNNNRYFNTDAYEIAYSQRVVVEESEAYSFHRHGFDFYQDKNVVARRNYANSRNYADIPGGYASNDPLGGDEAFVLYHTSDSIVENSIAHRATHGFQVHGGPNYDWTPGGQNNRFLGNITVGDPLAGYGGKIDSRKKADQNGQTVVWPAKDNLYKDVLIVGTRGQGLFVESAVGATLENVTIYNISGDGVQVKEGDSSKPWCGTQIPEGCSLTLLNSLIYRTGTYGVTVRNTANNNWLVSYSNAAGSSYKNFRPDNEPIDDGSGNIQHSMSLVPTGIEMSGGRTPIYIPADSNMKGVGSNGADIGANILYRYRDGALTQETLWDPATGAFPCGVIVPGVNDQASDSCGSFHSVLNVNPGTLPPDYGQTGTSTPTLAVVSTETVTATPTNTQSPADTATPTDTATHTATPVPTNSPAATSTATSTDTPTTTHTSTPTATAVSTASLDRRVTAGADDAEESATGSVSLTSSDLELVRDSNNQTVGTRFNGITIPPGAQIIGAYIQFRTDEVSTDVASLTIAGQASDNAPAFAAATRNISLRPRTAATVGWSPPSWPVVNEVGPGQRTPNIATIVQEIVNRPGWASGNSLAIIVTGAGRRAAGAFDGSGSAAPLLHIEFGAPSP